MRMAELSVGPRVRIIQEMTSKGRNLPGSLFPALGPYWKTAGLKPKLLRRVGVESRKEGGWDGGTGDKEGPHESPGSLGEQSCWRQALAVAGRVI